MAKGKASQCRLRGNTQVLLTDLFAVGDLQNDRNFVTRALKPIIREDVRVVHSQRNRLTGRCKQHIINDTRTRSLINQSIDKAMPSQASTTLDQLQPHSLRQVARQ